MNPYVIHVPRRFAAQEWGGTETVVHALCSRLPDEGYNTHIATTNAFTDLREEVINNVTVLRFPYFYPYLFLRSDAKQLLDYKGGNLFSFALMRHLRFWPRLDLLHLHTGKRMGGICRYIARKRNIPYIITLHGGVFDVPGEEADTYTAPTKGTIEWGKALGAWVGSRRVLQDAHAIICISKAECERVHSLFPHVRAEYFPNGVDTKRFAHGNGDAFRLKHGIPPHIPLILSVGRIAPQKNYCSAIRALARVKKRIPDAHYCIIGHIHDTDYKDTIDMTCQKENLTDSVTIIPGVAPDSTDLIDAYHAADVFLLPSMHEPFGIVILEAWSANCPVVASRVGGVPDFADNETNALLYPSNDNSACATAMTKILTDSSFAAQLAHAGKEKVVSHFEWDILTRRLASLYTDIRTEYNAHSLD